MSDHIKGFYVALDRDVRDDDFEYIKNAVLLIKGVSKVKENVENADDWINRERIRTEYKDKLIDIILNT